MPRPGENPMSARYLEAMGEQQAAAQGQTAASQESAAASEASQIFGGMPIEDFRKLIPQDLQELVGSEAEVKRLLGYGGMKKEQQSKLFKSENAAEEAAAFLNSPAFREAYDARRSSEAAKNRPRPAPPEGQAEGQTAVPGPSPAAQEARAQAEQGGSKKKAKKEKPKEYPKPVGPNVDTTAGWIDSVAGRFLQGQADASRLKRMEHKQGPDGSIESVYEFDDGSKVLAQNGEPMSVVPPATADGTTAPAPESQTAGDQTQGATPKPKKTSRFDLPFSEQVDARRKMYEDNNQNVNPLVVPIEGAKRAAVETGRFAKRNLPLLSTLGTLTGIAAAGYGLANRMGGGTTPPPPQQNDLDDLLRSYESALPRSEDPQQPPPGSPPMQPPVQPQMQPQPQANPAGMAPATNTTLLNRLMQSRQYA